MRRWVALAAVLAGAGSLAVSMSLRAQGPAAPAVSAAVAPALMPQPAKYEALAGGFALDGRVRVVADEASKESGQYLADLMGKGLAAKIEVSQQLTATPGAGVITLAIEQDLGRLGKEGYTLSVSSNAIDIRAAAPAGIFYGCQTLREMLPVEFETAANAAPAAPIVIPACRIEDAPRYPWRGLLVDTARHFFPKGDMLRIIDLMALHKLNVLQWHLTDDQGWRIEIKKYPKLTEISAWRSRAEPAEKRDLPEPIGSNATSQPAASTARYGGFYTQEEIREIVKYAEARHVTIVPEIEMPGHAVAALAAYPEFSCTGGPFEVSTHWGTHADVYCAGKDATFTFLEGVLDEVVELFPSPYIHVGGDEVPKTRWHACADCQKRIKDLGLKDEKELQVYFTKRIEAYLETKHKRLIGWDEILDGGLPQAAAITSWRGTAGGRTAAMNGHDVVMCPESNCYLDHMPEVTSDPVLAKSFLYAATVPLNKVYAFEPTPADLTPEQAAHILGAEGTLWSERIPTLARLEHQAFPRACALSEMLWTPKRDSYTEFAARLTTHLKRLDALKVAYYDDPMARASVVGTYGAADELSASEKELSFDVTDYLRAAGAYTARFEHLEGKGKSQLDIAWAALLENGKEIARDSHAGFAATRSKANAYSFSIDHLTPSATYTLRAAVKGTRDIKGQVLLIKSAAPATAPAP